MSRGFQRGSSKFGAREVSGARRANIKSAADALNKIEAAEDATFDLDRMMKSLEDRFNWGGQSKSETYFFTGTDFFDRKIEEEFERQGAMMKAGKSVDEIVKELADEIDDGERVWENGKISGGKNAALNGAMEELAKEVTREGLEGRLNSDRVLTSRLRDMKAQVLRSVEGELGRAGSRDDDDDPPEDAEDISYRDEDDSWKEGQVFETDVPINTTIGFSMERNGERFIVTMPVKGTAKVSSSKDGDVIKGTPIRDMVDTSKVIIRHENPLKLGGGKISNLLTEAKSIVQDDRKMNRETVQKFFDSVKEAQRGALNELKKGEGMIPKERADVYVNKMRALVAVTNFFKEKFKDKAKRTIDETEKLIP